MTWIERDGGVAIFPHRKSKKVGKRKNFSIPQKYLWLKFIVASDAATFSINKKTKHSSPTNTGSHLSELIKRGIHVVGYFVTVRSKSNGLHL